MMNLFHATGYMHSLFFTSLILNSTPDDLTCKLKCLRFSLV